jgi:hypothetical protein
MGLSVISITAWLLLTQPSWLTISNNPLSPIRIMQPTVSSQQPQAATPTPESCGQARVTANRVHFRPAPGLNNEPKAYRLNQNEIVVMQCTEHQQADGKIWAQVEVPAIAEHGWVSAEFLDPIGSE